MDRFFDITFMRRGLLFLFVSWLRQKPVLSRSNTRFGGRLREFEGRCCRDFFRFTRWVVVTTRFPGKHRGRRKPISLGWQLHQAIAWYYNLSVMRSGYPFYTHNWSVLVIIITL
jgi:hypothetical protein